MTQHKTRTWLLSLCFALVLTACSSPTPDEEQISKALDAMLTAAENRDADAVFDHVSDEFSGQNERYDRRKTKFILQRLLNQNKNIKIVITSREIVVEGDYATVDVRFLSTGGNRRFIPETGRNTTAKMTWKRESQWRLLDAEWNQ